jgi:DNA-binding CsgD family transcriptional regulator
MELSCQAERGWLDLVTELLQEPIVALPEERIATQLCDTFGAVGCAFHSREDGGWPVQRIWPPDRYAPAAVAEMNHWAVHRAPRAHPVLRYYLATGDAAVKQVADIPAVFAPRRVVDAWYEVGREWGVPAQLAVPVHFAATGHRAFVIGREDAFAAVEMALARRLQRLIVALDRHVGVLAHAMGASADAAAAVALTARELAVLSLVAEGLTSAAVARRLLIAERTVHKHLERIYAKLGVGDRVSAVLRAQRAGVLASAG